ncbi:MAG: TAT-variant-translocated molybdopterin oxidoreductase, partial [Acidobacteria bacterium]|nr:TAT-variant-translocated molybdopterin oxidoreductase [Acidobacteriota bacterium]
MTGKKSTTNRVDLAAIRGRVESEAGQRFWRGLEELAETPGYTSYLHHEFPHDPEKEPGA